MVLLVTGVCGSGCFYCPLSDEKRGREVMFANERPMVSEDDAIEEARLIDAEGTGVTGGDPAVALERVARLVRALKRELGGRHHVHLYTSRALEREALGALSDAGVDEVRFHPPPEALASAVLLGPYARAVEDAAALGMEAGYEVPVLPDKGDDLRAFLASLVGAKGAPFANLNELEFSPTNADALLARGYAVKDDVSAAVAGSEELGRRLVDEFGPRGLRVHYCSASFKDGVQLRRRLARRARNVARPHELVTDDQTLLKGLVEADDPEAVARDLQTRFDVPAELMVIDRERGALELAAWVLEELSDDIEADCYLVEEYPTWDRLEVEREPLPRRGRPRRRTRRATR
jgi:pyruvate formate-lyase activating enzyme-like uncharacterized protein